jgi:hypothetical protein
VPWPYLPDFTPSKCLPPLAPTTHAPQSSPQQTPPWSHCARLPLLLVTPWRVAAHVPLLWRHSGLRRSTCTPGRAARCNVYQAATLSRWVCWTISDVRCTGCVVGDGKLVCVASLGAGVLHPALFCMLTRRLQRSLPGFCKHILLAGWCHQPGRGVKLGIGYRWAAVVALHPHLRRCRGEQQPHLEPDLRVAFVSRAQAG